MPLMPRIETARLVLRAFTLADGEDVRRLAGDREVAAGTLLIPHPYPEGAAEAWIAGHQQKFNEGASLQLAVTLRDGGALAGAIGLSIVPEHRRAELGYWIGRDHWGRGYATEAAAAIVGYGFDALGLNRVYAYHFADNPASGRVMEKIGMVREGALRRHHHKWGQWKDDVVYGLVRGDSRPTSGHCGGRDRE